MLADHLKRDYLTGCFNREGFSYCLQELVKQCSAGNPLTVMITDLDFFKKYNDTYGHLCGDEVLKFFAESMRRDMGGYDHYFFRFGGDEFVVLFSGLSGDQVLDLARKIQRNLKDHRFQFKNESLSLTFSGGIASFPSDTTVATSLLDVADKALYASKKRGRDRSTLYRYVRKKKRLEEYLLPITVLFLLAAFSYYNYTHPALSRFATKIWQKTRHIPAQIKQRTFSENGNKIYLDYSRPAVIILKTGRRIEVRNYRVNQGQVQAELEIAGKSQIRLNETDILEIQNEKGTTLYIPKS